MIIRMLLTLWLLSVATLARADAIDPTAPARVCPPLTCPPGSHGVGGGHSGCPSECGAPYECDETRPCGRGDICTPEPVSLCIESVSFGNYEARVRRDACVDGACPEGQMCWTGRYCMPDPNAPPPATPPATPATPTPPVAPPSTPSPAAAPPATSAEPAAGMCAAGAASGSRGVAVWTLALVFAALSPAARRRSRASR